MWKVGLEVRQDISATMLRKKARSESDGLVASRLFAIANILDGMERGRAAQQAGMSRSRLIDWVHRYNAKGIEGLRDCPKGHAKRRMTPEQERELEDLVLQGPQDPKGLLVRWRRIDLQSLIQEKFGITYHERTIGKILQRLGFVRVSVRPLHPEANQEAQEYFKKTSRPSFLKSCLNTPKVNPSKSGFRTRPA